MPPTVTLNSTGTDAVESHPEDFVEAYRKVEPYLSISTQNTADQQQKMKPFMAVWYTLYTAKHMARTKTTILIEKDLLDQFKRLASLKHGTTRNLSSEVEEALRAFSPFEILSSAARRLNQKIDHYPSLREVVKNRPRVKISAGTIVREMRDERERHLLGHK